jgi:hypothetical protein
VILSIIFFLDLALLLAVMLVVAYRRLYKDFPFFFGYLLVVLCAELIRHVVLRFGSMKYFYAYWVSEAVIVLIAFLVLYEVFLIRLFPGFNIIPIYRYLFPIAGLAVAVLTVILFLNAPSTGPSRLMAIVGEFALALSFLQVGVLVFFTGLFLFMSRDWTRHDFGIALGFGVYGSVKLIVTTIRARGGYAITKFDQVPTIAYTIAALIWLFYLCRSDPEPPEEEITPEMVDEMDRVHNEMRQMLGKRKPD